MNWGDRTARRFGAKAICEFGSDVPGDEQESVPNTEADVSNRSKKRREYRVFISFFQKQQLDETQEEH